MTDDTNTLAGQPDTPGRFTTQRTPWSPPLFRLLVQRRILGCVVGRR